MYTFIHVRTRRFQKFILSYILGHGDFRSIFFHTCRTGRFQKCILSYMLGQGDFRSVYFHTY